MELAQFQFAEIMSTEKSPTLLNYGFLDGGFYTAADILPSTKYFCKLNLSLDEMTAEQNAVIKNKEVQFVVLRCDAKTKEYGSKVPYLLDNYDCISVVTQAFEHRTFQYCLLRAK